VVGADAGRSAASRGRSPPTTDSQRRESPARGLPRRRGVAALDERGPNRWFNTAAFATPSQVTLGTAGPGVVRGPGLYNWDITLRKVFALREGWTMRFEAQAFNLMNHVNFRNPSTTTSSAD
jgi:hypothetical protein